MGPMRFITVFALAFSLAPASSADAQIAVGGRYGLGTGTASYNLAALHARARLRGPLYLAASVETIRGRGSCPLGDEGELGPFGCTYDGRSISGGLTYAVVDDGRAFLGVRVDGGQFERRSRPGTGYGGGSSTTASVAVETELTINGPLRFYGGVSHRRVFDDIFEREFGEIPNMTFASIGLSLGSRRRPARR